MVIQPKTFRFRAGEQYLIKIVDFEETMNDDHWLFLFGFSKELSLLALLINNNIYLSKTCRDNSSSVLSKSTLIKSDTNTHKNQI